MAYLDVVAPDSEIAERLLRIEIADKEKPQSSANCFEA